MITAKQAAEIVYSVFPERCGITGYDPNSTVDQINYEIVIHFPEVLISNTKKQKHTIKDLFVRIKIENNRIVDFAGTRTTLSPAEIIKHYNHSHISQAGFGLWGSFCTGSSFVRELLSAPLTEDILWALLFNLEAFVSHESLEGRPYRHLSSLSDTDLNSINPYDPNQQSNLVLSNLRLLGESNFNSAAYNLFLSEALLIAFCEELQRKYTSKNDKNESVINFKYFIETTATVNFIKGAASNKNLIFDDLTVFGFGVNQESERTIHAARDLWDSKWAVEGDFKITKQKSSSDHKVEVNPKILVLKKLNQDLSITEIAIPAIKYTPKEEKKTKKPSAASGEYRAKNIGSGVFEAMSLGDRLYNVYHTQMREAEEYRTNALFLNNLI